MIDFHHDAALFREALLYTEAVTGFQARLIEKDYFCSVVLEQLQDEGDDLVFKGGTALSKIHARFYRMSEDLDFSIPVERDTSRSQRSRLATPLKKRIDTLGKSTPGIEVSAGLTGHNNSTQYVADLRYVSAISGQPESIKLEIGLREPVLDSVSGPFRAETLLLDPLRRQSAVAPFPVRALSRREAYAEKFRAALTRRDPAIRDFYDIDYGHRHSLFTIDDPVFLKLVRCKLDVAGENVVNLTPERLESLRQQIGPHLAPVLRSADRVNFDLDRAWKIAQEIAASMGSDSF